MDYYGLMFSNRCHSPRLFTWTASALAVLLWMQPAQAQPADVDSAAAPRPAALEQSTLDASLFYQLLLGELNALNGQPGDAFALTLDAARKTNDPRLYERAVNLALQARSGEPALQAARAWAKALPKSREANRYVLQILIGLNRLGETIEPLKRELASAEGKDKADVISVIPRFYARASDKKLAAATVETALADQLTSPTLGAAAWTTVGRMRIEAGDTAGVFEAAKKGHAIDEQADGPALLALTLMSSRHPQAEAIVRKYMQGKPQIDTRMSYARILLEAQRYAESSAQLQVVTTERPDYPPAWLILGTLELQEKKNAAAERSLRRYVDLMKANNSPTPEAARGLVQAYLSLAQLAEQRADYTQANEWLDRIDNAEDMISAQSRRAAILAKQGKLEEGRKLLRDLPAKTPADTRQKLMAEVQLLRDNKQLKLAYDLVAAQTLINPLDYDLLYDQAMLAEKIGELPEMERLLRRVIAGKPTYQHAYNALGYSLAERNVRLPEAKQLIVKALEFAPDDPFIQDSLAWVEFRSGNLPEALRILQAAFKAKPDAELAAHLGEVLWASGKRDQAMAIWREGVALNASNETLQETLKRLRVKL
jgi:predicted Zn-dependent protease